MIPITAQDFQLIFESTPGIQLLLLPDFTITAVSDAFLIATMTKRSAILGHGLFEIFPDNPDDNEANGVLNLSASLNYVIEHKQPHTMAVQRYDIRRPDGIFEVKYWSPQNTPVLNAQNQLLYIIHNVTDVTIRQTAENKLKTSENDYELLVNNVKDYAIFLVNPDGSVATWNSGAASIKGYSAAEIIGKPIDTFYTDENIKKGEPQRDLQMAIEHEHFEWEGWRLRKDGTAYWANIIFTALKDETGKLYGFLKIERDISERKKAQDALNQLNNELEQRVIERTALLTKKEAFNKGVLNSLNASIAVVDSSGNIVSVNQLWKNNAIENGDPTLENTGEGINYYAFCQKAANEGDEIAAVVLTGMKEVMSGKQLDFYLEYPCPSTIKLRWFAIRITKFDTKEPMIIVLHQDITERKIIEEKSKENEIRFHSIIENSAEGIALTDEFNNIIYRSAASQKITGLLSNENKLNATHPDDAENIINKRKEAVSKPGIPIPFHGRFLHPDGHYFWMEGSLTNMLHIKGVNAIVVNYRDISERKELEDLLHKANTLAKIGGWEVDLIKKNVYWTDITKEIHETPYSYVPDLKSGINFYKEGKGKDLIIQKVKEAIEFGKPWDVELQIITAKKNERWIRTIGETEFVNGKCIRIYGSFQDIDQRKKAEGKLVDSEKRFRALIENNYDVIILMNSSFMVTYRSPSAKRITGWSDEETINFECTKNFHPDDVENKVYILKELISIPGKSVNTLFRMQHKAGNYLWLEGIITNMLHDESVEAIVFNFKDVTDRIEAQERIKSLNTGLEEKIEIRTAQLKTSNEELEAFSYSISHDLRAPLRAVVGYTSILEEDYGNKLDEEAKRLTGIIKNNTLKMGNLIDDLLLFSRMGRNELFKIIINNNEIVDEIIRAIDRKINGNIEWTVQLLPDAKADINMMRQVWINLISNAVKYSGKNTSPKIEIGSLNQNGQLVYFVKDNGVGFDEKYKNKLFKVFQRLHSADIFEGTGVGLAIVDKIINKHHGKVWVEAAVNKGAVFYFSLPKN